VVDQCKQRENNPSMTGTKFLLVKNNNIETVLNGKWVARRLQGWVCKL